MFSFMKNALQKTWRSLLITFELQLLMFILLLPIFIWWGIAYSQYAFFGNILFLPFLWVFLVLSLGNVMLEFFHLPNSFFIFLQNKITDIWILILQHGKASWLWCFHYKIFIPSIVISATIFYIYTFKKYRFYKRLCFVISCILIVCITNYFTIPKYSISTLHYKHKTLIIFKRHNALHLIDNGVLGCLQNPRSWIEYTLLPACCKTHGTYNINTIILKKPTKKARANAYLIKQYSPRTSCKIS